MADENGGVATEMKAIAEGELIRISLDQIYIDTANNIRDDYQEMDSLQATIEATGGIIQPVLVAEIDPSPDTEEKPYGLIAGFRRCLCLEELAKEDPSFGENIPALVVSPESQSGIKLTQLIENLQRSELSPIETAKAIKDSLEDEDTNLTQKEIGNIIGKSAGTVSQYLKLLELPESVSDLLATGEISFSHARVIMYTVPMKRWAAAGEQAKGMVFDEFKRTMESRYGGDETAEGGDDAAAESTTGQKRAQTIKTNQIQNFYIPHIKKQIEEAESEGLKKLWQVRLDTVNWFLRDGDTELGKAAKPWEDEEDKRKETEAASKDSKKKEESFLKDTVRRVRYFHNPKNVEEGKLRPTMPQCFALAQKEVEAVLADDAQKKELGFELGDLEKFMASVGETFNKQEKDKKEAADKKAKEKAAKEEAEKTAADKKEGEGKAEGETAGTA